MTNHGKQDSYSLNVSCYATELDYIISMLNNRNIKYIQTYYGETVEIKIDNNIGSYFFKNGKLIEQRINLPE